MVTIAASLYTFTSAMHMILGDPKPMIFYTSTSLSPAGTRVAPVSIGILIAKYVANFLRSTISIEDD